MDAIDPFEASMLVGYYAWNPVFLEPMVSRAKLLEAESFTMDIPVLPEPDPTMAWPTSFDAVYDEEARAYRFVFSGFRTD